MTSKFRERVALERTALDMVNEALIEVPPLVGLSDKTVEVWLRAICGSYPAEFIDNLTLSIKRVAAAARSEANVSDEFFLDMNEADVRAAVQSLRSTLSHIS